MSKSMTIFIFHFFKSIKVQLPDKALKFGMPKIFRKNFGLNFLLIQNINHSASLVPSDNLSINWILR